MLVRANGLAPGDVDERQVRQALELLLDPAHWAQIQVAPFWKPHQAPAADLDALAGYALAGADGLSTYYLLNPLKGPTPNGANAEDVAYRRWLLVDVDRKKGEADKDCSATDAEKELVRQVAARVFDYLDLLGWPDPLLIDSGNGYHLLYRLQLENDRHSRALVRGVLYHLKEKFDTDRVEIDPKCSNVNRISKLPGTMTRKGPSTAERPHRMARLLHAPARLAAVDPAQLEALLPGGEAAAPAPSYHLKVTTSGGGKEAYARKALDSEAGRVAMAAPNTRNDTLNKAAFSLGQLVGAGLLAEHDVVATLTLAAQRCGLDRDDGGERGVAATIASGLEAGKKQPRQVPERNGTHVAPPAPSTTTLGKALVVFASTVKPRKVEWLWPARVALGKLTTFAGQGGVGKTFVLCDIAARLSRGYEWPDSKGECAPEGRTLIISGEDDPADTLVPRLIECGADLSRVGFFNFEEHDYFSMADLPTLEKAAAEMGPELRLVVIDPPTSFLVGVDDHKNAELRAVLGPLTKWAQQHNVAVIFNTHINKGGASKVDAQMRVMGSVAWVNGVRAAHMFAKDPEDDSKRLFLPLKMNLCKEKKGLAYRLAERPDDMAVVEWLGEVDLSADAALSKQASKPRRKIAAAQWLEELFAKVSTLPSKTVYDRAKEETRLSADALREAKDLMGIRARQEADDEGTRSWVWHWPAEARSRWALKRHEHREESDEQQI